MRRPGASARPRFCSTRFRGTHRRSRSWRKSATLQTIRNGWMTAGTASRLSPRSAPLNGAFRLGSLPHRSELFREWRFRSDQQRMPPRRSGTPRALTMRWTVLRCTPNASARLVVRARPHTARPAARRPSPTAARVVAVPSPDADPNPVASSGRQRDTMDARVCDCVPSGPLARLTADHYTLVVVARRQPDALSRSVPISLPSSVVCMPPRCRSQW